MGRLALVGVVRWVPVGLLGLGVALIGLAVATGHASVALLVIFPVVWGSSALLAGGVAALFFGILTLPLLWADESDRLEDAPATRADGGSGGVVLVGPFPFFFGSWKNPGRRNYWLAVAVGVVLLVVVSFFLVVWSG